MLYIYFNTVLFNGTCNELKHMLINFAIKLTINEKVRMIASVLAQLNNLVLEYEFNFKFNIKWIVWGRYIESIWGFLIPGWQLEIPRILKYNRDHCSNQTKPIQIILLH